MKFVLVAFIFVLFSNLAPAHAEGIIGDTCDSTNAPTNCQTDKTFLVCEANQCQCEPNSVWHEVKKVCVLKIYELCGPDAEHPDQSCGKFSSCMKLTPDTGHLCYCISGTTAVAGNCKANYGTACSTEETDSRPDCDPLTFSECQLSRCSCVDSVWDESEKKCRLFADAICGPNAEEQPCAKYSQCKPADPAKPTVDLTCQCQEGSVNNGHGVGQSTFGSQCDLTGFPSECDSDEPLSCVKNVCKCNNKTVELEGRATCAGLMGTPCGISGSPSVCFLEHYLECHSNVCGCKYDTVNVGGECQGEYHNLCNTSSSPAKCDVTKFLACQRNDCQCQPGTHDHYNSTGSWDQCVAGLNDQCLTPDGLTPDCDTTTYLKCNPTKHLCECQDGTADFGGKCQVPVGGNCGSSNSPDCVDSTYCDAKKCVCEDNSYAGDDGKCTSGVMGLTGGYYLIIILISLTTLI